MENDKEKEIRFTDCKGEEIILKIKIKHVKDN